MAGKLTHLLDWVTLPPASPPQTLPEQPTHKARAVLSKERAGHLCHPLTLDKSLVRGTPCCNALKLRSMNGSFKVVKTGNEIKEVSSFCFYSPK